MNEQTQGASSGQVPTDAALLAELVEVRARLAEAEDTLRAIRSGEVDAVVVDGPGGPKVYTLQGTDSESNQFRGEILAQIHDAVLAIDNERRVTYLNAAAERQYGVSLSEALGRNFTEIFTVQWDKADGLENARESLHNTGQWRGECRHLKRTGEVIEVEASVIVLRDSRGEQAGILSTIRDITERKKTEAALRASEAMTRSIFESSGDCIKVLDRDGGLLAVNPSGCVLMELDADHVLNGKEWASLWPEGGNQVVRAAFEAARDGRLARFQGYCPTVKGTPRWWDVVVAPLIDAEGGPAQIVAISRDITELHHATEALLSNEQRFRSLAEGMPHLIWEADEQGQTIYQNAKWRAYTGLTHEQTMGDGWAAVMHPEDVDAVKREWARAVGTAGDFDMDYRLRRASDGAYRWFHAKAAPVLDIAGRAVRWIGSCTDIHDQRRAEAELQASELQLRELVNGIGNLAWMARADGWIFWYNQRWYDFTGTTPEQMEGWGWQKVHDPEQLPRVMKHWQQSIESGQPFEMVFPLRGADGKFRHFLTRALPIRNPDGSIKSWFGSNTDITDQKATEEALRASEQRLRLGASIAGFAVVNINYSDGTVQLTPESSRLLGLAVTETVISLEQFHGMFHPEDRPKIDVLLQKARDPKGDGIFAMEHRIIRPDGEVRWVSVRKQVTFEHGNLAAKPVRAVEALLDITERKKTEIALSEAARRKDEFLAMLGHELRNPLTAIRHAIQIANESSEDRAACRWANDVIERQSVQLSRMVDDLLDVARITRGRIELQTENLELRDVFARAVAVVRPLMEMRRHLLAVEATGTLRVKGDPVRLEQVFVNLLNNAAKYTPEGGRVRLVAREEKGNAEISIEDNGVGISAHLLPNVFDLFTQADTSLDRAQGGLGIGLTVVKSLVEMHGGQVFAESGGGGLGSRFTVKLPLSDFHQSPKGSQSATPGALPVSVRVLIVDDHADAAEALARLLSRRNCEVKVVHDGHRGVIAAKEFLPHVLLLDLGLPGLDGYQLARTLRKEATLADSLFIAISGYAQDSDRELSMAAGFEHHCAKPVDFGALLAVIRSKCVG